MTKKKIYVFDWDDNLLHMPTKIKMQHYSNGEWFDMLVSTSDYRNYKHSKNYRLSNNPFIGFEDDNLLYKDTLDALLHNNYAPSFSKLIECILNGDEFAIITARSHTINAIRFSLHHAITHYLEENKINKRVFNGRRLEDYLSNQAIYAVYSKWFETYFSVDSNIDTPERKQIALNHFISDHITVSEVDIFEKFIIGYSDDDKKNLDAISDYIKSNLKTKYPKINFVVYDTSNKHQVEKYEIHETI